MNRLLKLGQMLNRSQQITVCSGLLDSIRLLQQFGKDEGATRALDRMRAATRLSSLAVL